MEFFDSHAHYDDEQFAPDRDALLRKAHGAGVRYIVNCASDLDSAKTSLALSERYPFVYAAVGLHPEEAEKASDDTFAEIERLLQHEKVVAIGEVGLDYHWYPEQKELQKQVFRTQLALAKKKNLPVIVHCREADQDCFDLVKDSGTFGVYHCFGGSVERMREILKLDYMVSFGGVVTFKNARRAVEAAREVPADRFLIETDCPYLAPDPMRGKRNSSLYLPYIVQKLAEIRNTTPEEIAALSMENAKRLFRIRD